MKEPEPAGRRLQSSGMQNTMYHMGRQQLPPGRRILAFDDRFYLRDTGFIKLGLQSPHNKVLKVKIRAKTCLL